MAELKKRGFTFAIGPQQQSTQIGESFYYCYLKITPKHIYLTDSLLLLQRHRDEVQKMEKKSQYYCQ